VRSADLVDALRARIAAREIGPRGALPSELDLAREYGTSRVTVRRALDQLRREGLVTSRRGAGWFVAVDPVRQPLGRVTTVEAALEAAGARPERRVLGFRFVTAPAAVVNALRIADHDEVLQVERVNLADDDPFALVTVWVRGDLGADVSRADVERSPFYDLLPLRGLELGTAHQIITAEIADATTAAHLACEVGDPLLVVRRTTHDAAGAPVLYSEHRYPAARTTFEIEFSLRSGTGVLQHA
jgi:GntR family transcriptional regulator